MKKLYFLLGFLLFCMPKKNVCAKADPVRNAEITRALDKQFACFHAHCRDAFKNMSVSQKDIQTAFGSFANDSYIQRSIQGIWKDIEKFFGDTSAAIRNTLIISFLIGEIPREDRPVLESFKALSEKPVFKKLASLIIAILINAVDSIMQETQEGDMLLRSNVIAMFKDQLSELGRSRLAQIEQLCDNQEKCLDCSAQERVRCLLQKAEKLLGLFSDYKLGVEQEHVRSSQLLQKLSDLNVFIVPLMFAWLRQLLQLLQLHNPPLLKKVSFDKTELIMILQQSMETVLAQGLDHNDFEDLEACIKIIGDRSKQQTIETSWSIIRQVILNRIDGKHFQKIYHSMHDLGSYLVTKVKTTVSELASKSSSSHMPMEIDSIDSEPIVASVK